MSVSYHHLDLDERRQIYAGLGAKRSVSEIARHLGRHRSTIFRELQRNTFFHEDHFVNGYFPVTAQELAQRRRNQLKKINRLPELKERVIGLLRRKWAPQTIAGDLKRQGEPGFSISHEAIYQYIYSAEGRALGLYQCLARAFKNRRRRFGRKPRHLRGIPQEMAIRHRPALVEKRQTFGHWEGDLMMFIREHGQANVTTLVERMSRFTILLFNQSRKSEAVMGRIKDKLSSLPRVARQSITLDRGPEFMAWPVLKGQVEMGPFYCDPRSPWQKGTNENTNGRVRRYLPSHANINEMTATELNALCRELNHTPRKCLGYRTPHEVFYSYLQPAVPELPSFT